MENKQVFDFQEGSAKMRDLLGGKGCNLAEMTRVGFTVPPGFTVTTDACRSYYENRYLSEQLIYEIHNAMKRLESAKNQKFGDEKNPLMVSVRSGAVTSMPGMMDTILNLGLNDITVNGLAEMTQNPRFAYDCYRRLIQMYGNVVFDMESIQFDRLLEQMKSKHGFKLDADVTADAWKELIQQYKTLIHRSTKESFPQNVYDQLQQAVEAVFKSWNNQRAKVYRKVHRIPDEQGTAVNIQSMVFGNMGDDCGTGVVFTRNPSTGEKGLYGEYLTNAQGEDVVAGIRTPASIHEMKQEMPVMFDQLVKTAEKLEQHYQDMQDIEFTIEKGKLYLLQTRNGKRTAQAAVKIVVDLVKEGLLSKEDAVNRIEVSHLDQLLHRSIDTSDELTILSKGLPASPGAASGQAVFDADTADQWANEGKKVILVSSETTPEDIHGVIAAEGVLTSRGGMTSHAAVVARGMGKSCVCGCEELRIDFEQEQFKAGEHTIKQGDWISIDGSTGRVILGVVKLTEPELSEELIQLLAWADSIRSMNVRTNADNPADARKARELGAEGIGLCRTEHMFMSQDRLPVVQEMILADNVEERQHALNKLLPMQQADFEGIFGAMEGLPVTIRLLDPPLHEFLPDLEELIKRHTQLNSTGEDLKELHRVEVLLHRVRQLHESNPMLGQRGCRLGILFPEIYDMQIEAIFRAALKCIVDGVEVYPEIMIPLVGHVNELKVLREMVDQVADQILGLEKRNCPYKVGTMIEVPRAAITASEIAKVADFFSFGTNDLTQMTFGYSRDDAEGKFLTYYVDQKLLPNNPFQTLDIEGVGQLIEWGVQQGRKVKSTLKTGICGEHGGDKESIFFCQQVGLDYVSCSPFRVPLARIAAAQAHIKYNTSQKQEAVLQ